MITKLKSLQNHRGFIKYFKNTSWLMLEKLLRMGLGLIVNIWTVRYLGPENFGVLSFAVSFVGLFAAFASLGLNSIVVRNLVRDPNARDNILGTSFILRLSGAGLLLLFVFLFLQFTSTTFDEKLVVMTISTVQLILSFEVIDFYFQSKVKGKYSAISRAFGVIAFSVSSVLFILLKLSVLYFALAIVIEQLTKTVFYIMFYTRKNNENEDVTTLSLYEWSFKIETAKKLLNDSLPLILAGIAISINLRIDQIMIKEFIGNEQVGLYAVAVKIADAFVLIPHIINRSIYPSFVNSHKKGDNSFLQRIAYGYKILFYISLILATIVFVGSDFIINTLFGKEYINAIPVLQLASITILFASINAINVTYFTILNKQKKAMYRQWMNVVLNLILNYMLIPIYGIMGAIYATTISIVVMTVVYDLFDKDCKDMNKAKLSILFIKAKYEKTV
jgi:O-antigen/teichoic acid export membrane protein